jgi:hypothetical protein
MKIDRYVRNIFKRLNHDYDNDNDAIIIRDDDYYLDRGSEPPRFAYYRHVRVEQCTDEWRKKTLECVWDTITQDELDYYLKAKLRASPEERYQNEKREWFFHELSYLHQTVDDNGKAVDIIKEYGCGHWSNKREGGRCSPECRFYPEYGRIEDEEVIADHNNIVESLRQQNAIVEPPSEDELLELAKIYHFS